MKKVKVSDKHEFLIDKKMDSYLVNDKKEKFDIEKIEMSSFHIIHDNKPYQVDLSAYDLSEGKMVIIVNGKKYNVIVADENETLYRKIGSIKKDIPGETFLKAPMPGLIVEVKVVEGQVVEKDDTLIVLKAMKMENVLKSPISGTINKIMVVENQKIEKDTALIQF